MPRTPCTYIGMRNEREVSTYWRGGGRALGRWVIPKPCYDDQWIVQEWGMRGEGERGNKRERKRVEGMTYGRDRKRRGERERESLSGCLSLCFLGAAK